MFGFSPGSGEGTTSSTSETRQNLKCTITERSRLTTLREFRVLKINVEGGNLWVLHTFLQQSLSALPGQDRCLFLGVSLLLMNW